MAIEYAPVGTHFIIYHTSFINLLCDTRMTTLAAERISVGIERVSGDLASAADHTNYTIHPAQPPRPAGCLTQLPSFASTFTQSVRDLLRSSTRHESR